MIIINDTVALGDSLWTFPLMAELSKLAISDNEEIFSQWTNTAVGELFPKKYGHKSLSMLPERSEHKVLRVSMHDIVNNGVEGIDKFSHEYGNLTPLRHWGFDHLTHGDFIFPELDYPNDPSVPSYDFIIAPYVLFDPKRDWVESRWQDLVDRLISQFPESKICVIGSSRLPSDEDLYKIGRTPIDRFHDKNYLQENTSKFLKNVDYYFDQPLTKVAKLLENVKKLFISVDSGPSAIMAGIRKPHLVLFNSINDIHWATYPGEHVIYKDTKQITVDEVFAKTMEILTK